MAKDWWKANSTGVIQCIFAAYCALLATLERYMPRNTSTGALPSAAKAAPVTPTGYVMPFWLWLGIIALVLSVLVPALLKMFKRRSPRNGFSQQVLGSVSDSDPLVYPEFIDARSTTGSDKKEFQAYFTLVNRSGSEALNIVLEPIEMHGNIVQFTRHRLAVPLLPKREAYFYPDVVTMDNKSVTEREKDLFHLFCLDYIALGDSTICEATKPVMATYQDSARNLFEVTCELVFDPSAHNAVRIGNRGSSPAIFTRNHKFRKVASATSSIA